MTGTQPDLLESLPADTAQAVLALARRLAVPAGAVLFPLGANAEHLFVIERGRVNLTLPMEVYGPRGGHPRRRAVGRPDARLVGADRAAPVHVESDRADRHRPDRLSARGAPGLPGGSPRGRLPGDDQPRRDGRAAAPGLSGHVAPRDEARASRCPGRREAAHDDARCRPASLSRRSWRVPQSPHPAPGSAATADRAARGAPAAVLRGDLPCSACHAASLKANRDAAGTHRHARRHRADATTRSTAGASTATTPANRDTLHLASGERLPFERVVPPVRAVPRREVPRLAGRRARPADRRLERPQGLPALRPLPQPAPAALQADPPQAGARTPVGVAQVAR